MNILLDGEIFSGTIIISPDEVRINGAPVRVSGARVEFEKEDSSLSVALLKPTEETEETEEERAARQVRMETGMRRLRDLNAQMERLKGDNRVLVAKMAQDEVARVRKRMTRRYSLGFARDHKGAPLPRGGYHEYRERIDWPGLIGYYFSGTNTYRWSSSPDDEMILRDLRFFERPMIKNLL